MRYLLAIGLAACVTEVGTPNNTVHDEWDDKLADRVLDYNAALRVAALRLTGELPTLVEMSGVATAADPKSAYETQVTRTSRARSSRARCFGSGRTR